jgi:hypothetical protein
MGKVRVSSKQAKSIFGMNRKEPKLSVSVVFRFVNSFAISVSLQSLFFVCHCHSTVMWQAGPQKFLHILGLVLSE